MRVLIAEDEPDFARQMEQHLRRFAEENQLPLTMQTYGNGAELVEQYRPDWDILLLDVDMPGLDGISAARCIRGTDAEVIIIFVTNLAQYAICGYEVNALDYVLKPVNYYALSMKLKKALRYCRKSESKYLLLNRGGRLGAYSFELSVLCGGLRSSTALSYSRWRFPHDRLPFVDDGRKGIGGRGLCPLPQ